METQNGEASGTVNGQAVDPVAEELRERFAPPNLKEIRYVEQLSIGRAMIDAHFQAKKEALETLRAEAEATPDETPATPEEPDAPAETGPETPKAKVDWRAAGRGMKKVWWKEKEKNLVAARMAERLRADGMGRVCTKDDTTGNRFLLDASRLAQRDVLPETRWKPLKSRCNLESNGLLERLEIIFKQPPPKEKKEPVAIPQVAPDDSVISRVHDGLTKSAAGVASVLPPPDSSIAKLFIDAATALVRAFELSEGAAKEAKDMNSLLLEEIDGLRKRVDAAEEHMRAIDKEERREVGHERAKLPSVAVLGCRKDEFDQIVSRAAERGLKLDLRHYDQDTKPRPVSAEWAVCMKFINHSWTDQLQACIQKGQYTLVRGGITQMVQQLEIWFGGVDENL